MSDKEFSFKQPDGTMVSATLPDTTPPAEAYQIASQQASETRPTAPQQTMKSAVQDIGTSGVAGAVTGAVAPEVLGAVGKGLLEVPNPWAKGLGVAAIAAGDAMKGRRMLMAADGLVSGLASETAGQIADARGAGHTASLAVRLGTGMLVPNFSTVKNFVQGPVKTLWKAFDSVLGGAETKNAAVTAAQSALGKASTAQRQMELHEILSKGSQAEQAAAAKAAGNIRKEANVNAAKVLSTNRAAALKIMDEGESQAKALEKAAKDRAEAMIIASKGKTATAARVRAMADNELTTHLAPQKELSDIGSGLRDDVIATRDTLLKKRTEDYKTMQAVRDKSVADKEALGQHVSDLPEMKELTQEIDRKALLTPAGALSAGGKAEVTDPGMVRAYKQIHDAIANKEVTVGVNDQGSPVKRTFKTTFEALDHVRRRLGEVGHGAQGMEGYSALGQKLAQDMYGRIAKIQEEFAGESQKALQSTYAAHSKDVADVSGKLARKATAVDKINMDDFLADPQGVPAMFFKSQQSVKDLQELVGNPAKVESAAKSYLARNLTGHDATYVKEYLQKPANTDWMREVPGLKDSAGKYLERLQQIERVAKVAESRAVNMAKGTKDVIKAGGEAADVVRNKSIIAASKKLEVGKGREATAQRYLSKAASTVGGAGAAVTQQNILRKSRLDEDDE